MQVQPATAGAYQLFHEGSLALARAERQGIRIDVEYCQRKQKHLERKLVFLKKRFESTTLYKEWESLFGLNTNINSDHQLAELLYNKMGIKPIKTTKGGRGSTDEETLKHTGVEGIEHILEMRKVEKLKTTYLEGFMTETTGEFMHPSFNLHNVISYRSSSRDPNFQNIPVRDREAREITRRAIIPRDGHMLMEADFSSLEVNIAQCYHHDPQMGEYLSNTNADMHLDMAKQIFLLPNMTREHSAFDHLRDAAKGGFVFPQFYGDYYKNAATNICRRVELPDDKRWNNEMGILLPDGSFLSQHLRSRNINCYDDFENYMKKVEDNFWNRRFMVYGQWRKDLVAQYRKKGWLQSHTGFVYSGLMKDREIFNYPIQGSAFHCLLYTFIELDKIMVNENWNSRIIGQIHDSIVMDVDPAELEHVKATIRMIVREKLPAHWDWIIVSLDIDIDEYGVDQPWLAA